MKWFHHDTDMHQNRKIRKLIRIHGATGYAFWCLLLEKLYSHEEGFQISADELWFEDIAEDLRLGDYRTPIRVLDTLAELGLIEKQLWQEHVIASPAISKRGDSYIVKRTQEAEKKRRYREKLKAMSTVDNSGTEGQCPQMSPSDPDTDPKSELNKTICRVENGNNDADAPSDLVEQSEPEPSEPASESHSPSLSKKVKPLTTQTDIGEDKSSAAREKTPAKKKDEVEQRFEERLWQRYPGTHSTGDKGHKGKAAEKFRALLKAGISEDEIYSTFEWDLARRKAKWDCNEFAESFPHLVRYLGLDAFKDRMRARREDKQPTATARTRTYFEAQPEPEIDRDSSIEAFEKIKAQMKARG